MKKLLTILGFSFLLLFMFSLVGASDLGTFQQNKTITLFQSCPTCSYVTLTSINFPDGTTNNLNVPMIKTNYSYTYNFSNTIQNGNYKYTTCGDKSGSIVCETIGFKITPSGRSGTSNSIFFIIVMVLLYGLTLLAFFNKIESLTALSGMALGVFGLYMIQNGIIIYRDWFTNYVSYVTIGVGFMLSLWALIEWIQETL